MKLPGPAVKDSNIMEKGDGVGMLVVAGESGEAGGGRREEVGAATGRFTVIPVSDSVPPADTCNRLPATTKVTPLKINNETQTLTVIDESFWQKHKARILFSMSCTCFTAATLALTQFFIKSIIAII